MAREIVRETRNVPADTDERTVVTERDEQGPAAIVSKLIYAIFAIILTLLTLRFILALFGANTANAIVGLLYDLTQPFVAPFSNFFTDAPDVANISGFRFEIETLIAIIFFLLIGWVLAHLVGVFDARSRI